MVWLYGSMILHGSNRMERLTELLFNAYMFLNTRCGNAKL